MARSAALQRCSGARGADCAHGAGCAPRGGVCAGGYWLVVCCRRGCVRACVVWVKTSVSGARRHDKTKRAVVHRPRHAPHQCPAPCQCRRLAPARLGVDARQRGRTRARPRGPARVLHTAQPCPWCQCHAAAQLFKLMQHGLARARSKRRTWLACVALALVAHSCGGTGCTELAVPWDFTPCVTWQRVDANCLVRNI